MREKSHTSTPSIVTDSILRTHVSQDCNPINGFPDCHAVESEDVAIVPIADTAFC